MSVSQHNDHARYRPAAIHAGPFLVPVAHGEACRLCPCLDAFERMGVAHVLAENEGIGPLATLGREGEQSAEAVRKLET